MIHQSTYQNGILPPPYTPMQQTDGRRREWIARTKFQKWAKPLLERNEVQGKYPGTWQELHEALVRLNDDEVNKTSNYIYQLLRGDPAKVSTTRPGYNLAYAIGKILGDVAGALTASDYPLITLPELPLKRFSEEAEALADYYEGLAPGPERDALSAKAYAEQERRRAKVSREAYRESNFIGKLPEGEDDVERIPED